MGEWAKGTLAQMATEGWTGRVVVAIEHAIRTSFESDQVIRPVMTRNEIDRRFRICVKGFAIMRRDLGWAIPRILDEIPRFLRCELDGMTWRPDEDHAGWLAQDGERMTTEGEDMSPASASPLAGVDLEPDTEDPSEG